MSEGFGHAYLSVLGWPPGMDEAARTEALVAAAALDLHKARSAARAQTPLIVTRIDPLVREDILGVLHGLGVLAFAPSDDELLSLPKPEPVKRVLRFPETDPAAFAVDDNDEDAWTFTSEDVRLVVFGRVLDVSTRIDSELANDMPDNSIGMRHIRTKVDKRMRDMMDIHIVRQDGERLLRLTEPRTLIRPLSEATKRPSVLNPPDPVGLIEPFIPLSRIDVGFNGFNAPVTLVSRSVAGGRITDRRSTQSFGFYSLWKRVIQFSMLGS